MTLFSFTRVALIPAPDNSIAFTLTFKSSFGKIGVLASTQLESLVVVLDRSQLNQSALIWRLSSNRARDLLIAVYSSVSDLIGPCFAGVEIADVAIRVHGSCGLISRGHLRAIPC